MTDDLRDRIAAVLYSKHYRMSGILISEVSRKIALEAADAVIAELGLRLENGQRSNATGPLWGSNNRHNVTRYVTEWTPDD